MNPIHILPPITALALLTFVVAGIMVRNRVSEMQRRRIHPQAVATRAQVSTALENNRAADNYANLFEMPVLFYVLCLALYVTQTVNVFFVAAAWAYVALRVWHSVIQLGKNKVMKRFRAFMASALVLLGMWLGFGACMVQRI